MNPKIQKLRSELEKNSEKIAKLQSRNSEIKQQIRELENEDIVGLVRANGINMDELAQFLQMMKTADNAAEKEDPGNDN